MLLLAIIVGTILLLLAGRHLCVAPHALPSLAILAGLVLVMPNEFFSSFGADRRIPIASALVAIAATDWRGGMRASSPRLRAGVMAVFMLALMIQVGGISRVWARSQKVYRAAIAGLDRLPPDARLLAAVPASASVIPPFYQALQRRTPQVVIWPGMMARLRNPDYAHCHGPFRPGLLANYDAVLVIDPGVLPQPARPPNEQVIARIPGGILLRLPRTAGVALAQSAGDEVCIGR